MITIHTTSPSEGPATTDESGKRARGNSPAFRQRPRAILLTGLTGHQAKTRRQLRRPLNPPSFSRRPHGRSRPRILLRTTSSAADQSHETPVLPGPSGSRRPGGGASRIPQTSKRRKHRSRSVGRSSSALLVRTERGAPSPFAKRQALHRHRRAVGDRDADEPSLASAMPTNWSVRPARPDGCFRVNPSAPPAAAPRLSRTCALAGRSVAGPTLGSLSRCDESRSLACSRIRPLPSVLSRLRLTVRTSAFAIQSISVPFWFATKARLLDERGSGGGRPSMTWSGLIV